MPDGVLKLDGVSEIIAYLSYMKGYDSEASVYFRMKWLLFKPYNEVIGISKFIYCHNIFVFISTEVRPSDGGVLAYCGECRASRASVNGSIKRARIAQFLKEYWGIRDKGNNRKFDGQNVQQKTTADIAEVIGESPKQTQRLMKLNDLIPQIQELVLSGKLGTTAAEH
jgi:hypothetical protein